MKADMNQSIKILVTIDVDCMHGHTENHAGGRRQRGRDDRYIDISYQYWLPRYLDLLAELELRSNFFFSGRLCQTPR